MDNTRVLTFARDHYAGVLYAARFFVTRNGFLRSSKRILALSTTHLLVIDPYTEDVKESFAYQDIKEIVASGDVPDKVFTIVVGKNRDSYSSRNRQAFLSAYYQLRERSLSMSESNPSGLYFDSSFHLCGKSFSVTKLSSTRRYVAYIYIYIYIDQLTMKLAALMIITNMWRVFLQSRHLLLTGRIMILYIYIFVV